MRSCLFSMLNVLLLITFLSSFTRADEPTGVKIIQIANDVFNQDQAKGIFELTITTTTDQKRTFVYESFSKDRGEKTLMRYLEPSRVKGQATLMLNNADDIWVYFPRTKRVRKLASHAKKQKMEGSDFAYEDMGGGESFLTDFNHRRLLDVRYEGRDCYQVELIIKPGKESSYSRMVMLIDRETYLMQAVEYYDEKDPETVIKRLTITDVEKIQGVPTPMRMVMRSLYDNTESIMSVREIEYKVDLPDEMFTERGLTK